MNVEKIIKIEKIIIILILIIDLVISIIAVMCANNCKLIIPFKDVLKNLSGLTYVIIYLPYFLYLWFLIVFTLYKTHKYKHMYILYFIQILFMTVINNGLLLYAVDSFSDKNFASIFNQNSFTIINSIFVGVLAYLGITVQKVIKIEDNFDN